MHLPQELVTFILVRLPAKSLSCFKCVCKTWRAIIESPSFMDQRLKVLNDVSTNDRLYLIYPCFAYGRTAATFLLSDEEKEVIDINGAPCIIDEHELHEEESYPVCPTILEPINGVYCISTKRSSYSIPKFHPTIRFWNPGTEQVHVLPPIPLPVLPDHPHLNHYYIGFGYDPSSNDYKVVSISEYGDKFSAGVKFPLFHVYSLASNSWDELDLHKIAYPSLITLEDDGQARFMPVMHCYAFTLGNACHWRYDIEEGTYIVSFHMVNHVFRATFVSTTFFGGRWPNTLTTVDGCLALVCQVYDENSFRGFNIGVMKEYGVEESWTIAYKIRMNNTPSSKFIGIVGDMIFFQVENLLMVSYCVGDCEQDCREYCHVAFERAYVLPFEGSLVPIKPRL